MEQVEGRANSLPEWLEWDSTLDLLKVFGGVPPSIISDWAEQCRLVATAGLYFENGKRKPRGELIPISVWRAAREQGGLDLRRGTIDCEDEALVGTARNKICIRDIQVNSECLAECLELEPEDAAAAHERAAQLFGETKAEAPLLGEGLHFLKTSRPVEPMTMDEALCRAVYGRPSADILWREDGPVSLPGGSEEEAGDTLDAFIHSVTTIHKHLQEGRLCAYVENPSTGAYMRVDRLYWLQEAPGSSYRMKHLRGATGWDDAMLGQPIVADASDLLNWQAAAQEAKRALTPSADIGQEAAKPKAQTKPKPRWYPLLRTLFEEEERRHAEWPEKHPGKLPPRYRSAADYRRLLIEKKIPEAMVPESTVRHHVRALKLEFGR